jgi:hypothetical protein
MRHKPQSENGGGWAVLVLGLVLLPVLYVGSMRPAYRSLDEFEIENWAELVAATKRLNSIYRPVWWAAERWEPLNRVVRWWAERPSEVQVVGQAAGPSWAVRNRGPSTKSTQS